MAQNVLARITGNAERVPGLSVNLVTGIPAPDLIADGLDVVIRVGRCRIPASFPAAWAQCRWCSAPRKAIWRRRDPEKPADLASHSWLEYSVRPDNEFEIIARKGSQPDPQGRFVTNDPMTLVAG
jgi:DNA-binding transcriptional LysR family regulator